MGHRALIAFGAVVILAGAGAQALKSIDQGQGKSPVAIGKPPATMAAQQAEKLPAPRLPEDNPPPTTPVFEGAQPVFPVLCGTHLTLPPRPMHSEQGCKTN